MIFWKEKNGDGFLKFLYEIFQRKEKLSYKLNIYFLNKTTHSEKDSPFSIKIIQHVPRKSLISLK